jgi:uncharacterized protein with FMN-binding domain
MKRATAAVLGATALALPNLNAWAAATAGATTPKTKTVTAKKSFAGILGSAGRWGDVQVTIVVRRTTMTNLATHRKKVTRKIMSVSVPLYPNHTDRSIFINQQALPILIQEATQAQLTGAIDMVSGATDTSDGFEQSLQAAILMAKAW